MDITRPSDRAGLDAHPSGVGTMSTAARRKEAKASGEPGWTWRKWALFPAMLFSAWRLIELEGQPDTTLNQVLAYGHLWLLFGEIVVFTGFATIQDITAIWATRSGLPYTTPSHEVLNPDQRAVPITVDPNLKESGL